MLTTSIVEGFVKVVSDDPIKDLPDMAAALKALKAINRRMKISFDEMDLITSRFTNGPRDFECDFALEGGQLFLIGPTQGLICIADRLDFA